MPEEKVSEIASEYSYFTVDENDDNKAGETPEAKPTQDADLNRDLRSDLKKPSNHSLDPSDGVKKSAAGSK